MELSHGFLVHLDPKPGSESVVIIFVLDGNIIKTILVFDVNIIKIILVFDANIVKIILVFDVNIIKNHHRTMVTISFSAAE